MWGAVVTWPSRRSRCPVCGQLHHACGGPTNLTGVDQRMEARMPRSKQLQPVEVITQSGLKTTYLVAPDEVQRYQRMSERNEQARSSQPAKQQAEGKARSPRRRSSGAVETK